LHIDTEKNAILPPSTTMSLTGAKAREGIVQIFQAKTQSTGSASYQTFLPTAIPVKDK
jgi:hypothetical protein